MQSKIALASEIWPAGKWRFLVRGFSASNLRSTIRLNAIAHVRAQTIAVKISRNVLQPGQPRLSRAATIIAASANGSANTVCEKRTNEPHLDIVDIISLFFLGPAWREVIFNPQMVQHTRHHRIG